VNWPAFQRLISSGPGGPPMRQSFATITHALFNAKDLWCQYFNYLAYIFPGLIFIFVPVVLLGARKFKTSTTKLFFMLLIAIPAALFIARINSTYPWGNRYYSPFFGVGFALYVLFFQSLSTWASRTLRMKIAVYCLLLAGCFFSSIQIMEKLPKPFFSVIKVPPNFSPYFASMREVQSSNRPILWIHNHCYASDIPLFYFGFLKPSGYSGGYQVVQSHNCEASMEKNKKTIIAFLRTHPDAQIVLDQKEKDCSSSPREIAGAHRLESNSKCIWVMDSARSIAEVNQTAQSIGFFMIKGCSESRCENPPFPSKVPPDPKICISREGDQTVAIMIVGRA
jgi:hypothetical protein